MKVISTFLLALFFSSAHSQETDNPKEEYIINTYLRNGAWTHDMFSQEYQQKIEEGLKLDSTVAYLWQQKAVPLFFQQKYQLAMKCLDKAAKFKPDRWLDYRAFMKCIYARDYEGALKDFDLCIAKYGNRFVMDHSYETYRAICYLQMNQFEKSEKILTAETEKIKSEKGENWIHPLELFYLGIVKMEQKRNSEAIIDFERAILNYAQFSDAKYYRAVLLHHFGKTEEASKLIKEAQTDFQNGYTITDNSAMYERYPYQVNWKLVKVN